MTVARSLSVLKYVQSANMWRYQGNAARMVLRFVAAYAPHNRRRRLFLLLSDCFMDRLAYISTVDCILAFAPGNGFAGKLKAWGDSE